ncbi:MAG: hypothetical protein KGR98_10745 [Verrucomicrobia bacterium]|nr:hypothetical protein [Verrucomicrobiota bacterium]MDE3098945.1 hypothetical protein [Verrucomicrobiota bacterium]
MTKTQILDLYFLDARHKLVEIAAFLDRLDRADSAADFRAEAFHAALDQLPGKADRAERILLALSDPTAEPVAKAETKGACGAWQRQVERRPS